MKIDKEKFNALWTEVYNRVHSLPYLTQSNEYYYLSGCLDTMRKIKDLEEKENDNAKNNT
jgi:hypothetical protein